MIGGFPVTKLSRSIPENGVHIAKHGSGTVIAQCAVYLQDASLSELTISESADQNQTDKAEKTRIWVEGGLKLLMQHTDSEFAGTIQGLIEGLKESDDIAIEFLIDHDHLMDLSDDMAIRCDTDVADEIGDEHADGIIMLYALGLLHTFSSISGADEKAALNNDIAFWEDLEEDDRHCVIDTLSHPQIDSGNVFLRFLQNSIHKPQHEKDKLIAWVRSRSQIDLPYDDTEVIKALEDETDLAALRLRIYNAINDTYVQSVDTDNANRIAERCLKEGRRIVAGRFSRALYIDAMLMANARLIDARHLRESIFGLEKQVRSSSLDFEDSQLSDRLPGDFSRISGEMQMIVNLAAEERLSLAQIEGALSKFKKALREFETYCLERLDSSIQHPVSSIQHPASSIQHPVSSIQHPVSSIQYPVSRIEHPDWRSVGLRLETKWSR